MSRTDEARKVGFCPHCGHMAPQSLLTVYFDKVTHHRADFFTFAICDTCQNPLIYFNEMRLGEKQKKLGVFYYGLNSRDLAYPKPDVIHRAVPEKIVRWFTEALRIKGAAPTAFAASIRRCLEMVCHDRGALKGALTEKLADLADKKEIPPALSGMTEIIRLLGNAASHDDVSIEAEFADTIEEFFRAILDYVYVRPHQINDIKVKFDQAKKKLKAKHP